MSTREEIREGIARRHFNQFNTVFMDGSIPKESYRFADIILSYLHSQGVVLKVERELPAHGRKYSCDWFAGYNTCKDEMAGLKATEPLV